MSIFVEWKSCQECDENYWGHFTFYGEKQWPINLWFIMRLEKEKNVDGLFWVMWYSVIMFTRKRTFWNLWVGYTASFWFLLNFLRIVQIKSPFISKSKYTFEFGLLN
jgi:hypothetical protein